MTTFAPKMQLMNEGFSYLNKENIARSKDGVEWHPLIPFLPENAQVLFLGSFPPQRKRWCIDFYYPNFINDHWRIEGQVFFGDRQHFVDLEAKRFRIKEIVDFCQEKGIASDKFLEVVQPTDIPALLARLPRLKAIVTTGEKATETICASLQIPQIPKVNTFVSIPNTFNKEDHQIVLYRLPSSSRAYPLDFDKKVMAYRQMFDYCHMI